MSEHSNLAWLLKAKQLVSGNFWREWKVINWIRKKVFAQVYGLSVVRLPFRSLKTPTKHSRMCCLGQSCGHVLVSSLCKWHFLVPLFPLLAVFWVALMYKDATLFSDKVDGRQTSGRTDDNRSHWCLHAGVCDLLVGFFFWMNGFH